jgi:hypothetical protein
MRVALALALAIALPAKAALADDDPVAKAAGNLASAVFANMATSYMCRDALGGTAWFDAAVTTAEGSFELMGYSSDDAVLTVDEMATKFKNDPRAAHPDVDQAACLETVNARMQDVKVATARYRKAAAATN